MSGLTPPSAQATGLRADTVLGKAMLVLEAFSIEHTQLTFAEIQAATGLPKSTTHRLLGDLVTAGLLDRREGRYRLSRLVFELGMRASVERGLLEVSLPFLEDLRERTHETVHLGVREGFEVVYVAKFGAHGQAASPSRIGGRMPLHATAVGKVLLAYATGADQAEVLARPLERFTARTVVAPGTLAAQLERVRANALAYEHEESAPGIVCVAAPILDHDDDLVAAISVTGPVSRFQPTRYADTVQAAARGISATLGRRAALLHR